MSNIIQTNMSLELCGDKFNLSDYLKTQVKTKQLVLDFSTTLKPGMLESDVLIHLENFLDESGLQKRWHPTKFRAGINTTCSFRDLSTPYTLAENDIFFLDIGPVYFDHEGDYGETFVFGSEPKLEKLRDASKNIFYKTQEEWRKQKLTGAELYEFADQEAKKLDLRLNSNMYGHRLGDFPHALFSKEKLGNLEFSPVSNLWVLEIHLIDDQIQRGAFFEDILSSSLN